MAADQTALMTQLGFANFSAAGHDRGARVLHRMALDFPGRLQRLAFLDILPTTVLYEQTDRHFATSYWEWFFFAQGQGFPEKLLSVDPESFLRYELGHLADDGTIAPEIWNEYLRVLQGQASMHGMCEDYRAGATIDLAHDAADTGRRIEAPLLLLWGSRNPVWKRFDMIGTWQRFASSVVGHPIQAGHYIAEEAPDRVLEELVPFMRAQSCR
jgi:haloacetate dehalogenase